MVKHQWKPGSSGRKLHVSTIFGKANRNQAAEKRLETSSVLSALT
jgi:hypothetical protein